MPNPFRYFNSSPEVIRLGLCQSKMAATAVGG
jgi:hypothetical protein